MLPIQKQVIFSVIAKYIGINTSDIKKGYLSKKVPAIYMLHILRAGLFIIVNQQDIFLLRSLLQGVGNEAKDIQIFLLRNNEEATV